MVDARFQLGDLHFKIVGRRDRIVVQAAFIFNSKLDPVQLVAFRRMGLFDFPDFFLQPLEFLTEDAQLSRARFRLFG